MTKILALDLATVSGAAWRDADGAIVTRIINLRELAGVPQSRQAREHGKLFAALHETLQALVAHLDGLEVIAIEDDTGRNKGTAAMLSGYRAIVHLVANAVGVRVIDDLDASQARGTAGVGGGSTTKEVATGNARRFYKLSGSDDEIDAAILLIAIEHTLKAETVQAQLQAAAKASRRKKSRAAA